MFGRVKHLVIKEFIQALRGRRTVFFLFVTPLVQLFVFGYVATMDVNRVSTALYDVDRTPESRELVRRLEASGYFSIDRLLDAPGQAIELLDRAQTLCVLQINRGFGKDVRRGIPAKLQVLVDGTDSNTALIAISYVNAVVAQYARDTGGPPVAVRPGRVEFRTRIWYNPDLRSKNFFVPGVIASIIMLTCLILTSMSVVREREMGTMEQLMVTPIRPFELMLGKTIPAALIGYFDMSLVTAFGVFWFDVPIKGSLFVLVLCTGVYLLSVLGTGLFISTISRTQQQALMATFLFFQPAILLSGFASPIESMPDVFQYLTYLSPLRYFLVIVRGIFLKGVGLDVLWPQVAALFVLGSAILGFSSLRFKKRLG